jgi:ABC transporter substrate binding protein (PQQ-dependent alcohol dehydrogenase system)
MSEAPGAVCGFNICESDSHKRQGGRLRLLAGLASSAIIAASTLALAQPAPQRPAAPQATQKLTIGFVDIEGDPRYEPIEGSDRIVLKVREHPFTGAQVGLDEAQALSRVLKTDFALERITVKSAAEVGDAVQQALTHDIHLFLVDAPAEAYKPLATAVKGRDALIFNVSAGDDALRRDLCTAEMVHVIPSLAMRMDGLVQYLVSKKWRDYLVLQGPADADAATAKAFENSAKKFGARIAAHRNFKAGTDPREREQNDPALLTAISRDYDVVFVADEAFDFARGLPYHTVRPRPIVGNIDLEPVAWHWTWDHNGAPQVNSRFEKKSGGRRMESGDWAAWVAVKMIVQSALRTRSIDFAQMKKFILGDATFDGDKGLAVSVRPWDHQVRQAVLLAAPYQVVASAPIEGFLHRTNELDTLGDDEPETPCHLNK